MDHFETEQNTEPIPVEQPEQTEEEPLKEVPQEEKEENEKKKEKPKKDEKYQKLLEEKEEYLNALIRERADFENFKKRNAMVTAKAYKDGMADFAREILPVVDNLERALVVETQDTAFKEGIAMVLRQMKEVMEKMDITEIEAQDQQFDPNLHEAVMQVECEEGQKSNTIVEVLRKGYAMQDRILRHSMVKVAQ